MIDDRDRGFLLGDGVFETLLVMNRVALWREEHLARMKKAARKLDIPFDLASIVSAIEAKIGSDEEAAQVLRVTLTRGVTMRGLAAEGETPTLLVGLEPFDLAMIGRPLTLATASVRRNPASVTDRHKTTSYANNVFAAREAKSKNADDALILNQDGLVACTSIANIFLMKDKTLVTPPEQDGALAGIMRRFLIEQAHSLGFAADVRSVEKDELVDADAVFVTNSLRLMSPVHRLDGVELQRGDTSRLMQMFLSAAKGQCGIDLMEKTS